MSPNAQSIIVIARYGWHCGLPVSWAIAECHAQDYYRPWIKRFITTIYETMDCTFGGGS